MRRDVALALALFISAIISSFFHEFHFYDNYKGDFTSWVRFIGGTGLIYAIMVKREKS